MSGKHTLYAVVALLGIGAGIGAAWMAIPAPGRDPNPDLHSATVLYGQARPLPPFTLVDHRGQPFGLQQLQGRWSLLFFGYTHCPDICPTTMMAVNAAMPLLADTPLANGGLQVGFVSVDPERDTVQHLAGYVGFFNPAFVGITGEAEQIDVLSRAVGAVYRIEDHAEGDTSYLVDHSSRLLLIDPQGRFHAVFSEPHEPETLARDLAIIVAASG